jgi:plasmid stability protein
VAPNGTEKTVMSAQVPTGLRDGLMRLATEHDRSMSAEVRSALRDYLERSEDFSAGTSSQTSADVSSSDSAASAEVSAAGEEPCAT